jgi:hypothetical protein
MFSRLLGRRAPEARTLPGAVRRRSSRGVVMVEYTFLLVFFGVPVTLAVARFGAVMVKSYVETRNNLLHQGP